MTAADHLEVEVKFLVDDLDAVRARLAAAGAKLGAPRVHERNVRFDTADAALLGREELLRLRQDTRVRLTYKGLAAEDAASEAKIREELEVTVDDFDRMATILHRLGFAPAQTYEKYRETFHWGAVEVVLDELPFGYFVELEGPSDESLKAVAGALGLDWSRRVLDNYLALMEMARRAFDLPFSDLTFANFERHPVSMGQLLPMCVVREGKDS
ncbi:class IV adenylate cyclase [Promineifilum sp.]|uniref:class IV adenylate cyclase n=1 Tax=Promineifilum sp. TaxID=2664178 RepID=UPI0035B44570